MSGFAKSRLSRLHEGLRAPVERGEVPGLVALAARGNDIHVEVLGAADLESGAPMRRDTIFRIASMTKPIAAAAAMILVEEARLRLDGPVARLLPELASPRVLRSLDADPEDTVPANRAVTLRDLLTFTFGFGMTMAPPGTYPIQKLVADAGLAPGPNPSPLSPDDWIANFAKLPLMHQPGERWMYHTGFDVLAVLVARAANMPFDEFLAERIFDPLGMKDTSFAVPEAKRARLAVAYEREEGRLKPSSLGLAAVAPGGGSGLFSTADDYLAFARMMMNGGAPILSRPAVELMTLDQLTPAQKSLSPFAPGFWERNGWGFGMSVVTRRDNIGPSLGAYGWDGGFGTSWRNDPREDMTVIFLSQRMMTAPDDIALAEDFHTLAWQAIAD
jgi:CubicO group peptidase (beta-lactamase class C family)